MPTVSRGIWRSLFSGVAMLEDFADRLSHVWTFGLLLVCAAVISWRQQLFNAPIVCFTPSHFTGAMVAYAHSACWTSNLNYHLPLTDLIPTDVGELVQLRIWNYKWLPVILCIQALLFKFPSIVMYVLHGHSGVSFEKVACLTEGYQNLNLMERAHIGKQTGRYLYNWCKQCENFLPWRVLSISWLLSKILFCVNAVVQLTLLDKVLSTRNPPFDNSTSFGDAIYSNLFDKNATEWKPSPMFPRQVLCDYQIRQLQSVQRYTLQCDLPTSEFNECIYMLIWIWLLIVTIISWLSFVVWLVLALLPISRERYISRMLELSEELNAGQLNKQEVSRFTGMVGEDGVMVLKLMASNASEFLVRDAVTTMFQMRMGQLYPSQMYPSVSPLGQNEPLLASGTGGPHVVTNVTPKQ